MARKHSHGVNTTETIEGLLKGKHICQSVDRNTFSLAGLVNAHVRKRVVKNLIVCLLNVQFGQFL
jgi:hypothetical protein